MSVWPLSIPVSLRPGALTFSAWCTRVLSGWCSEAVVTTLVTGGHLCQRLLTLTVILKLFFEVYSIV